MIKNTTSKRKNTGGLVDAKWIMENDCNKIIYILGLKKMERDDVIALEGLIRTYIDTKCKICRHCPAQVKFGFNRLKRWWENSGKDLRLKNEKGVFVAKMKK
jgi:hypothetical protein